jgi:hypothetical protein
MFYRLGKRKSRSSQTKQDDEDQSRANEYCFNHSITHHRRPQLPVKQRWKHVHAEHYRDGSYDTHHLQKVTGARESISVIIPPHMESCSYGNTIAIAVRMAMITIRFKIN